MMLIFRTAIIISLLFPLYSCTDHGHDPDERVFKQIPELQEIKPLKPVKIKLKRNAQGEYSWDLSGNDTERIIEADNMLQRSLEKSE